MKGYWYNYKTSQYEYTDAPTNDTEAKEFLPQINSARGLYDCHRALRLSVLEAMVRVLECAVGVNRND